MRKIAWQNATQRSWFIGLLESFFMPLRYFYVWGNVDIKADSTEKHLKDPVSFK